MTTTLDKNIDGISCEELHGSNFGEFSFDSSRVTRWFRCAWGDRIDLAKALVGDVTTGPGGTTVQIPPKAHPEFDGLFARTVRIGPFKAESKGREVTETNLDAAAFKYDFAFVEVIYEPFVADFGPGDQLITEEFDISAELLEMEGSGYLYEGTSIPHSDKFFKVIGHVEDQIVFHRSAVSKRSTIKSLVGRVNAATLADTKRGSMLFLGGRGRRNILTSGVEMWEIAYKFRSRKTDDTSDSDEWQKVFRAGTGWVKLVRKDDNTKNPYEYGDFTTLFT